MLIEIKGAGFKNKGAELMTVAVLRRLRQMLPQASFCVSPRDPFVDRRMALGLLSKVSHQRLGVQWGGMVGQLLPAGVRRAYGLVLDHEIDAVIDITGFGYSDQISARGLRSAARTASAWARRGVRLVLMPQAFGPFTSRASAAAMAVIVEAASLVCARDRQSEAFVRQAAPAGGRKIRLMPDLTVALAGDSTAIPVAMMPELGRTVLIVPNRRMLEKARTPEEAQAYLDFLADALVAVDTAGRPWRFLLHDPVDDLEILKGLAERGATIPASAVIQERDPLVLKGLIGSSWGIIGSRFHAIVGALSSGVPALVSGWSHKYGELMRDFACPETCLVDLGSGPAAWRERLMGFLDEGASVRLRPLIQNAAAQQRALIEGLWDEVGAVLRA